MKKLITVIISLLLISALTICSLLVKAENTESLNVKLSELSNDLTAAKDGIAPLSNSARYTEIKTGTGKTVYVSEKHGNDYKGDGTKTNPFKTIAKGKESLSAGDTLILGDGIYTEKIGGWQWSGTENEPITIMAEKGAKVAVTTYDPITTDWQLYSENIYVTNIGIYDDISHALWLKDDGFHNLVEARWPNVDADHMLNMERAIAESGTDNYYLYSSELPEGDWTGATVYTWTGEVWEQYVAFSRIISEYKAGEYLIFSRIIPDEWNTEAVYRPREGNWFYLTNSLSGLDGEREYYYDNKTGNFYIIMPQGVKPSSNEIWVEKRDYAVELWECKYINFANINFIGGGIRLGDTDNCILANANVYYADWFRDSDGYATMGIDYNKNNISGSNNLWINSEIAYTMSNGILLTGDNNTISNCLIHDVNITGGYNAAVTINPDVKGTVLSHNTMYRSGRFLIYFAYDGNTNNGYPDTLIEYNDLYDAMHLTSDGGIIYAYHRNGDGVVIRNNWVHDTDKYGARGIYIDNNCSNFVIYRNCVWNIAEAGLVLNTDSENNLIYNNTIVNCGEGIQVWPKNEDSSMKGTKIINNIISGAHDVITGKLAPYFGINLFSDTPMLNDYLVPNSSDIIDKGEIIDDYDVDYKSYPDLGAYEHCNEYWVAGVINYGDVNFDKSVNGKDVLRLRRYLADWNETIEFFASDFNKDGKINAKDVLTLRRYLANW